MIMEFHEKLQELRKQKGLTQEELAQTLYVSRTAISKWESGRGYPNIESLKAIAKFYCVTIDELLSCEEALNLAEATQQQKDAHLRDHVFGLLDFSAVIFLFAPFFGQRTAGFVQAVSLFALTQIAPYLKIAYCLVVISMIFFGVLTLTLQNYQSAFWTQKKAILSLTLNAIAILLFIITSQPYCASLLFLFLAVKAILLIKKQ